MKELNNKCDPTSCSNPTLTESMTSKMDEISNQIQQYSTQYAEVLSLPDEKQNVYWSENPNEKQKLFTILEQYESVLELFHECISKEHAVAMEEFDSLIYKLDEHIKYSS